MLSTVRRPAPRFQKLLRLPQRHNLAGAFDRRLRTIFRPGVHEPPALVEQVAAAIGGFDRVADRVRQGLLANLAWRGGALGRPIAEGRAKAVDARALAVSHFFEEPAHRHGVDRDARAPGNK